MLLLKNPSSYVYLLKSWAAQENVIYKTDEKNAQKPITQADRHLCHLFSIYSVSSTHPKLWFRDLILLQAIFICKWLMPSCGYFIFVSANKVGETCDKVTIIVINSKEEISDTNIYLER